MALETWTLDNGCVASIDYDTYAPNPRDDWEHTATLVQLSGWIDPDKNVDTHTVHRAWDYFDYDFEKLARYLRLFHGALYVTEWTGNGGHVIAYVTREAMERAYGTQPWLPYAPGVLVEAELAEYRQWAEGEVYEVAVTSPDGREESLCGIYTEHGSFDDDYVRETAQELADGLMADTPYTTRQIQVLGEMDTYAIKIATRDDDVHESTHWMNITVAQLHEITKALAS